MDEASRNVTAFLAAVSEAQSALLPVINVLWDGGHATDIDEPYAQLSFHVSRYLVIGVKVDARRDGRRYEVRVIVDWYAGKWKIGSEASSLLPMVGGSYRTELLHVPGRVADTLDGFVSDLRAVTSVTVDAFRRLVVGGPDPEVWVDQALPPDR